MMTGVHDFPHVSRAGSPGSRLKRTKTVTLRMNSSVIIRSTRRTMYAATLQALQLPNVVIPGEAAEPLPRGS
jgi:hypothetical protein